MYVSFPLPNTFMGEAIIDRESRDDDMSFVVEWDADKGITGTLEGDKIAS